MCATEVVQTDAPDGESVSMVKRAPSGKQVYRLQPIRRSPGSPAQLERQGYVLLHFAGKRTVFTALMCGRERATSDSD